MVNKLYYSSAYIKEWETKIDSILERNHEFFVTLEETAFYPHGGGQPCDFGWINEIPVLDVFMEEDQVLHKIESLPDKTEVKCKLDWERRFDHMQHHSGQHLLSSVCLDLYQARTVSFHLGLDFVSIDVNKQGLTEEQIDAIEKEANKRIYQNRTIHSYFVTSEQLKDIPVVKMPKVTENIRIVEIDGIEYNACGGTHVFRTGEIGIIKLYKVEKQKDCLRIYFKCGYRALDDYNEGLQILETLAARFNTSRSEILDRFTKWEQEQKQLKDQIEELKQENVDYLAGKLLSEAKNGFISDRFSDKSVKDLQQLASKLAGEQEMLCLFLTTPENKMVFMHNGSKKISCGKFFKDHLADYNGKGGGNDQSAQAGFPSTTDALRFFEFAKGMIERIG